MHRLCFLTSIAFTACAHPSPAPTPVPPSPLVPVEIVIPDLVEPPDASGMGPYVDELYALGWSADSTRFAYAIERADEACGCLTVDLAIVRVASGQVWWSDHFQSDERSLGAAETLDFEALWALRGAAWSADLKARGIVLPPTAVLVSLPVGGDAFPRVEIRSTAASADSAFGFPYLTSYDVELLRGGEPSTMAEFHANGSIGPQAVDVAGYLAAPDELHAIGIVVETWRGWEGQQQVKTVRVVSATI